MVAARWARHLDASRGRLTSPSAALSTDKVDAIVALLVEAHQYYGHVWSAAKTKGHVAIEVVAWLDGGLQQMARPQWNDSVERITDEADKMTKSYAAEREKEWRSTANKSLDGGARAAHRFAKLPPAAEVRKATANRAPAQDG